MNNPNNTIPEPLTPEQIAHWRKVLFMTLGPYAFLIPPEQIQVFRDRLQIYVNSMPPSAPPAPTICTCDPARNGTTTHKDGRVTCNKCHLPREN